eukprot:TRINITY_DN7257_c0_g1_i5.p1 TRINITY_DN7257_c0_g1~~TRINITY_DN7257_c0_g1_i5.p1  ORF type:complete len:212 (-),score=42.71 TRINITY_DN7257_c0_g1_i5:35-670(-)
MYIFGGWNNVTRFNDMYYLELDRQPMRWIRVDQGGEIPGVRHDASGAQFEKEGRRYWIMWGGAAGYNLIKNDFIHWQEVMAFDFEEMTWMVIPTDTAPPPGVEGHRCWIDRECLFVYGGHNGFTFFEDLHWFDLNEQTWHSGAVSEFRPPLRACFTLKTLDQGKILLVGGYGPKSLELMGEGYLQPKTSDTWNRYSDLYFGQVQDNFDMPT